jgi:hypothetical protein
MEQGSPKCERVGDSHGHDLLRSEPVSFSAVIGYSFVLRRQIETRVATLFYEALGWFLPLLRSFGPYDLSLIHL